MSEFQVSAALLRTRLVSRPYSDNDRTFENGDRTKPVTKAYQRQAASLAAERAIKQSVRGRATAEERAKAIGNRRKWGGGGNMPAHIRENFSEAERAALAVIAEQCKRYGYCDKSLAEIARIAGVGRTSVQNALRKASGRVGSEYKGKALISVRERPNQRAYGLTNIIKIVCGSWLGWIKRAAGFKLLNTSETKAKTTSVEQDDKRQMALEETERVASSAHPAGVREWLRGVLAGNSAVPGVQARTLVDDGAETVAHAARWAHVC